MLKKRDIQPSPNLPRNGCFYRLLWLSTALMALVQVGLVWRAAQIPPELAAQVSLSLPLEFVGGLLWALIFALVTLWLVLRRRGALRAAGWTLVVFALYNGARWLVFTRADYDRQRLPFLGIAAFVFVIIMVVFVVRRPQQTERTLNDRESKD